MEDIESYDSPSEAAEALLDGNPDNMTDPATIVGGALALQTIAQGISERLDDPYALCSPRQAADFLTFVSGTLDALGEAIPKACAAVEAARTRGDLPADSQSDIADVKAILDEVGMWTSDSMGTLEPVAQRLANLERDYTGYVNEGEVAYVHKLAAELAGRPGIEVGTVYEPETDEYDQETLASVDFALAGVTYRLVHSTGWEVYSRDENDCHRTFEMRGAFASSVHPAAVVDEALAAMGYVAA